MLLPKSKHYFWPARLLLFVLTVGAVFAVVVQIEHGFPHTDGQVAKAASPVPPIAHGVETAPGSVEFATNLQRISNLAGDPSIRLKHMTCIPGPPREFFCAYWIVHSNGDTNCTGAKVRQTVQGEYKVLEGGRVDVPLDKCEALFVIRHLPS